MTSLIEARREFEEAKKRMMHAYEIVCDTKAVLRECSTEYARSVAERDYAVAVMAWEELREKAREASRRYNDLKSGIASA